MQHRGENDFPHGGKKKKKNVENGMKRENDVKEPKATPKDPDGRRKRENDLPSGEIHCCVGGGKIKITDPKNAIFLFPSSSFPLEIVF